MVRKKLTQLLAMLQIRNTAGMPAGAIRSLDRGGSDGCAFRTAFTGPTQGDVVRDDLDL